VRAAFQRKETTGVSASGHTPEAAVYVEEGPTYYDYATIRQTQVNNTGQTPTPDGVGVRYDLPQRDSNSSGMSVECASTIHPFPTSQVKYCYVPTMEQRSTLSNVQHYEVYESLWTQQKQLVSDTIPCILQTYIIMEKLLFHLLIWHISVSFP
jgi:hypothetical protein